MAERSNRTRTPRAPRPPTAGDQLKLVLTERVFVEEVVFENESASYEEKVRSLLPPGGGVDERILKEVLESLSSELNRALMLEFLARIGVKTVERLALKQVPKATSAYELSVLAIALATVKNLQGYALLEKLYRKRLEVAHEPPEIKDQISVPLAKILDALEGPLGTQVARRFRRKLRGIGYVAED